MDYLILYLQVGCAYLTIVFLIFLVDAFVIHTPKHAVNMLLGKPYQRRQDILKITIKAVLQVIIWPFGILLFLFAIYILWKERKESSRQKQFRSVALTTFYERRLDPERRHIGWLGLQLDGTVAENDFIECMELAVSCPHCLAAAPKIIQIHGRSAQKNIVAAFNHEHEHH